MLGDECSHATAQHAHVAALGGCQVPHGLNHWHDGVVEPSAGVVAVGVQHWQAIGGYRGLIDDGLGTVIVGNVPQDAQCLAHIVDAGRHHRCHAAVEVLGVASSCLVPQAVVDGVFYAVGLHVIVFVEFKLVGNLSQQPVGVLYHDVAHQGQGLKGIDGGCPCGIVLLRQRRGVGAQGVIQSCLMALGHASQLVEAVYYHNVGIAQPRLVAGGAVHAPCGLRPY